MRTTFDVPDPLFRHLKARAALEGTSLRDLLLTLIERALAQPPLPSVPAPPAALPSVRLGAPMALPAEALSNAALSQWLDD
ncbi:MAG: hypothetical protein Q4G71_17040 [Pseudomonadota bacterium]|nr:hypothetical protein [Pseudomonadota bacterium]